jgi:hypothetical protein
MSTFMLAEVYYAQPQTLADVRDFLKDELLSGEYGFAERA